VDKETTMGDKLRIFISHKSENGAAARGIKNELELNGGNRVEVFISEDIRGGDNWFDWIKTHLVGSNMLLLLFTEPSASWDWCLYEAGLFTRLNVDDASVQRRVVCLRNPDTDSPGPLEHLQAVPVQVGSMKQFLRDLYGNAAYAGQPEPINPALARNDEALDRVAGTICTLFAPLTPQRELRFNKHLDLHVKDPARIEEERIPADARVESDGGLELFGLAGDEATWGSLEAAVRDQKMDTRWIGQLADCLYRASRGRTFRPVQAIFQSAQGQSYKPILAEAKSMSDGSMIFHVLFDETVAGSVADVPTPLGILVTALRMGMRMRYEVLQKCLALIGRARGGEDVREACEQVRQSIYCIESEAASRGAELRRESLGAVFAPGRERNAVMDMYDRWADLREELFHAMDEFDAERGEQVLEEMLAMNAEFMTAGSRRYHELVKELLAPQESPAPRYRKRPALRAVGGGISRVRRRPARAREAAAA
jgi:hypothetical protein